VNELGNPQARYHRDKAAEVLTHYFRIVMPDLDNDNRLDLEEMVDHLIRAAVIEATDIARNPNP
jgi:hypothetical protein